MSPEEVIAFVADPKKWCAEQYTVSEDAVTAFMGSFTAASNPKDARDATDAFPG